MDETIYCDNPFCDSEATDVVDKEVPLYLCYCCKSMYELGKKHGIEGHNYPVLPLDVYQSLTKEESHETA